MLLLFVLRCFTSITIIQYCIAYIRISAFIANKAKKRQRMEIWKKVASGKAEWNASSAADAIFIALIREGLLVPLWDFLYNELLIAVALHNNKHVDICCNFRAPNLLQLKAFASYVFLASSSASLLCAISLLIAFKCIHFAFITAIEHKIKPTNGAWLLQRYPADGWLRGEINKNYNRKIYVCAYTSAHLHIYLFRYIYRSIWCIIFVATAAFVCLLCCYCCVAFLLFVSLIVAPLFCYQLHT